MKANRFVRTGCVGTLCVSLILGPWPRLTSASSPDASGRIPPPVDRPVADVALSPDGRLSGVVVDGQNRPLAGAMVVLVDPNRHETVTHADSEGRFAFLVPRGGVYGLNAGTTCQVVCRLWTWRAAPPYAQSLVSIRASEIIRGQSSPTYQWISEHPWLFYTGLATAITVPLVIFTNNGDKPPASP